MRVRRHLDSTNANGVEQRAPDQAGASDRSEKSGAAPDPWRVEGSRSKPAAGQSPESSKPGSGNWWLLLIAILVVNWVILAASISSMGPTILNVPSSLFRAQVEQGNVASVTATGQGIQGTFRHAVTYPTGMQAKRSKSFKTERPVLANDGIFQQLLADGASVGAKPATSSQSFLEMLLLGFGPTLLLVGLFVVVMRGVSRSAGGVGLPGAGKTLLAKAVAGEAEVPFFSMSASEFIEMIVGVGASRVRDQFDQAKKEAPSIIFIDEFDAIGRSRAASVNLGGSHDEREQTLNQILTEMDGFTGNQGVIVLAATNRPEILDAALLRPDRFDRRIAVNPPDQRGREAILRVHTRSVPLAPEVDLATVAATTPGMVAADLRNLVNEAALLAARRNRTAVGLEEFADALEKVVLGAERRIVISSEERERTAYHESRHALLGMLQPGADPVRKVSIIPRGHALGATSQSPEKDRYDYDDAYLRGRLIGLLSGRAAEEVVFGSITSGAESDLEQATAVARQMAGRWGMSDEIGLVTVLPPEGARAFGLTGEGVVSEHTRELLDSEVRRLTVECHKRALDLLADHRERLDALAHTLLEHERLDEADAYAAAGIPHVPATEVRSGAAT